MNKTTLLVVLSLTLLLTSCAQSTPSAIERRIQRVESGLLEAWGDPPWDKMTLAERMEHYNVAGVSIAVINDFQIEWAKGYGVLEAGGEDPVTPDTLFQAASIGKPVVATAMMYYVEQGRLDLDEDVNNRLVSWKIPENEFTVQEKVTLRRLLSHSAGVTISGFRGYAQSEPIPSLQQVLDGEPPANSPPIRVDTVPGALTRYSGGGYVIVQQLLMDVLGKPFPEIMDEIVLQPVGMSSSTFESPLPTDLRDAAARGHWADGRPIIGGWHTYPEMGSGASLWSTPSDLARFGIEIMRSYAGQQDRVLSPETVNTMLTRQRPQNGDIYGLGFELYEESGDQFYFGHSGWNEGYRCTLALYPELGRGAVVMTNNHAGDTLISEIMRSISAEYALVPNYTILYSAIVLGIIITAVALFLFWRRRKRASKMQSTTRS